MEILYIPMEVHVKRPHADPAKHSEGTDLQKYDLFIHAYLKNHPPFLSKVACLQTRTLSCWDAHRAKRTDKGAHLTRPLRLITGVTKATASLPILIWVNWFSPFPALYANLKSQYFVYLVEQFCDNDKPLIKRNMMWIS